MKFPAWASQWYFSPDQKAQLQFEITMKTSVICLFRANPTGATSDLTSLFSNIRGGLCFRFLSTVSRSNELPLSFNPCVGGEGFPSSDPIVSLKHRTDRRVLGSELLTLHSLAAVVKRTLRLQGVSLFLPFLFSPKELPFLPHPPPLTYRKKYEGWRREQIGHISKIQRDPARIKAGDGKNVCCCFWDMHQIKRIRKTF